MDRAERVATIMSVLQEDAARSDREVARLVGAAPGTVARLRRRLEAEGVITRSEVRIGHDGRRHPRTTGTVVSRRPGELPDPGLGELVGDAATALFGPAERRRQRRLANYVKRVAIPLADLGDLDGGADPDEVAAACIATFGSAKANELATALSYDAHRIYRVSVAIGKKAAHAASA